MLEVLCISYQAAFISSSTGSGAPSTAGYIKQTKKHRNGQHQQEILKSFNSTYLHMYDYNPTKQEVGH